MCVCLFFFVSVCAGASFSFVVSSGGGAIFRPTSLRSKVALRTLAPKGGKFTACAASLALSVAV